MFFGCLGEYEDVIQVDYRVLDSLERSSHVLHEDTWCVGEAEGYHLELILPRGSPESGLLTVGGHKAHLVIPREEVQTGENGCALKTIQQIINSWQREVVSDGQFVQGTVVIAHPPRPVLLESKHDRRRPWGCRWCNEPPIQQVLHCLFHFLHLRWRVPEHPLHYWPGSWLQRNDLPYRWPLGW